MSDTYDKIEITNPDGTKRGITDADFKNHKTLDCGCRISTGGLGWLMTQYRACKADCANYLLWKAGELSTDGEKMCRECCQTIGHADWCSVVNRSSQ